MFDYCYPHGKRQALTFSYDDGEVHDRRLIDLFNEYQIKSTFHLCGGWIGTPGYINEDDLKSLYDGHEIAAHGYNHRYLSHLSGVEFICEIENDRLFLESHSSRFVRGFAYPFGEYRKSDIHALNKMGIAYARTVQTTGKFLIPDSFYEWHPTCHHDDDDLFALLNDFLNPPAYRKLSLMMIYGHSFEFERNNNWSHMERLLKKSASSDETWYATNIEIYEYITAIRNLIFNMSGNKIKNNSSVTVWFFHKGSLVHLLPGEEYEEN